MQFLERTFKVECQPSMWLVVLMGQPAMSLNSCMIMSAAAEKTGGYTHQTYKRQICVVCSMHSCMLFQSDLGQVGVKLYMHANCVNGKDTHESLAPIASESMPQRILPQRLSIFDRRL